MTRTINIATVALAFAWLFIVPTWPGLANLAVRDYCFGYWPMVSVSSGTRTVDSRGFGLDHVELDWSSPTTLIWRCAVVGFGTLALLWVGRRIGQRLTPQWERSCGLAVLAVYGVLTWMLIRHFVAFYSWCSV